MESVPYDSSWVNEHDSCWCCMRSNDYASTDTPSNRSNRSRIRALRVS